MRRIMTWIFYAIGGVGMAIFAVGMGDDMPNPISFTASPETNMWIFQMSGFVSAVSLLLAIGISIPGRLGRVTNSGSKPSE